MQNEPLNASTSTLVPVSKNLFVQRLIVGIVQGVLLYGLLEAARHQYAIARLPLVFVPLLLVSLYLAPVVEIGLSHLRLSRLAFWSVLLALIVAIVGYHDAWRAVEPASADSILGSTQGVRLPSLPAAFFAGVLVFIGYTLIVAGETSRAWFAPYEAYFELSWKMGLQVWLSLLFVVALHLVLWAGAVLFMLVKLNFLQELLRQDWFYVPVSAMAFAGGLHITDVRPDLIRGTRTLVHSLMSWLLLILVLIAAGFLASLPFKGFDALWATRSATWILLVVVALMIIFINAVFKSGSASERAPRVLRICVRAASLMMPILTALAAYALALRIGQYGLTNARVLACACVLVACCYALGYAWAAFDRRDSLARLAPVNVATAWVSLAVLFALFTPLADPARLSVNSQVDRLLAGRIAPDHFDYRFLQSKSAIYGRQALTRLQTTNEGPNAAMIRDASAQAARATITVPPATIHGDAAALARNIVSRTPGTDVPASFISNDWHRAGSQSWLLPPCMNIDSVQCDAYMIDLTGDHRTNVLLIPTRGNTAFVFGQSPNGQWQVLGRFTIAPDCTGTRNALASGTFKLLQPRLQDLEVDGRRLTLEAQPPPDRVCRK